MHSHGDVPALITLDHCAFLPCCSSHSCSSWYSYGWHCLLHSCSSPMEILLQILQVYICNFGKNWKAPLGCIIPLICNLFTLSRPSDPPTTTLDPLDTHAHHLPLRPTTTKSARLILCLTITTVVSYSATLKSPSMNSPSLVIPLGPIWALVVSMNSIFESK